MRVRVPRSKYVKFQRFRKNPGRRTLQSKVKVGNIGKSNAFRTHEKTLRFGLREPKKSQILAARFRKIDAAEVEGGLGWFSRPTEGVL